MAFDDQMKQKFIALLNERGVKLRCPVCGTNNFGFGGKVALLLVAELPEGAPIVDLAATEGHPMVTLHCTNCFAVQMFDAKHMGLLD